MNGLNYQEHQEGVDQTVAWAEEKLAQHPDDGDRYWQTTEGKDVIAIAEASGLI